MSNQSLFTDSVNCVNPDWSRGYSLRQIPWCHRRRGSPRAVSATPSGGNDVARLRKRCL